MANEVKLKAIIDASGSAKGEISSLSGVVNKLGGVGGVATAAGAGLVALGGGVLAAGAGLVSLGSDANEMQSKFDVVFGAGAPAAQKALDEFGNEVGRSTFELMDMSSGLQDILVAMGFTREEAAQMSVDMSKLSVDVGSFKNVADTDVMDRFRSGLVGNHDALDALGIAITEATLNQELMNMGVEGGTKSATEQEKVMARMNIIMNATKDAQGDAARTSGGWANQMRALKAELSESATAMGVELLPVLIPLLKDFTTWVRDVMPQAVTIFKTWSADMKATVGPALLIINDAIDRVTVALGGQKGSLDLGKLALTAFKAGLDSLVIAIKLGSIAIKLFADGVEQGRRNFDTMKNAVVSAKNTITGAMNSIKSGINSVISGWNRMRDSVRSTVAAIPAWLRPGSPTPFELGLRGIAGAAGTVSKALPTAFDVPGGGTPAVAAATAGSQPVVNFTYAPMISLADRYEAEQTLLPIIQKAVRGLK